jgi:hypothetical protein
MIAGILALIQALPELFKLLNRLGDVVERFMKWSSQNNLHGWIDQLEASIDKLEKAETPKQKLDAAESLVGAIRKLS